MTRTKMTILAFQGRWSCRACGATANENVGRVANPSYKPVFRAAAHVARATQAETKTGTRTTRIARTTRTNSDFIRVVRVPFSG